MSCGCTEPIAARRPDDELCNLCAGTPRGVLYQAQLTVGPRHTYRADLCGDCWDWIRPLYESR